MRAPKFWYPTNKTQKNWQASLLKPFSHIYKHFYDQRTYNAEPYKASMPVICVGNAVAGGGGKTPTALYLFNLLKKEKRYANPALLLRGYKGSEKGPLLVSHQNTAKEVGDEPVLLTQYAPVIVAKDKKEGIQFAEHSGFDCLIMDDGYQNPDIEKDLNILVVDERGFGNGKLLPAGPLREPSEEALQKADIIITKEPVAIGIEEILDEAQKPVFIGRYKVKSKISKNIPYVAFSGIAAPEKFRETLEKEGADIKEFYPYPDHYNFDTQTIERLKKIAHDIGDKCQLITTEKDWVRLSEEERKGIQSLEIELDLDDDREFSHLFLEMLKGDIS